MERHRDVLIAGTRRTVKATDPMSFGDGIRQTYDSPRYMSYWR